MTDDKVGGAESGIVWHDFCGNNCEGPCRGWDGVSRRCDCGNRRVCWADEAHSYAEAY